MVKRVGSDYGSALSVLAWIFSRRYVEPQHVFCLLFFVLVGEVGKIQESAAQASKQESAAQDGAGGFQTENVSHAAYSYEFIYVTSGVTYFVCVVGP